MSRVDRSQSISHKLKERGGEDMHSPDRHEQNMGEEERKRIQVMADAHLAATTSGQPIPQWSEKGIRFDVQEAYRIQTAQREKRLAAGEKLTGFKMGLTSEAKRRQMNLDAPVFGFLTDQMVIQNNGVLDLSVGIHPKAEPEVALRLGRPLHGNVSFSDVQAAVSGVAAAIEILDSRYQEFQYFSLPEVIADNSSSWRYVLGPWRTDLKDWDPGDLAMRFSTDGRVREEGSSAAISGHPYHSVIQLCELLALVGQSVEPGQVILTGAATAAIPLVGEMRVALEVSGLESVNFTCQP